MKKIFNEKAQEKLENIQKELFVYIRDTAFKIKNEYKDHIMNTFNKLEENKANDYSVIDTSLAKIKLFGKFYEEINNNEEKYQNDLVALKEKCMDKNVYYFYEYYSKELLKQEQFNSCTEDYIINNILLPFQIIEIKLNNDDEINIIYNIPNNYGFEPINKYNNTFLGCYLDSKKELNYTKGKNYEKEILEIINDDNFMQEFFEIISSKTISQYFESRIKFEEGYNVTFVEDDKYDIYLKENYQNFIKEMKSDYKKFRKLIIIKQICYKIPAMTDSSMRIFVNPIYEISGELRNNNENIKSVLKSALLVLLVHELAHLLKAYNSKETLQKNYPITPRKKESGRCLIYYLFKTGVIHAISYEQSVILNDISVWKDLNKLRTLFKKPIDNSFNTAGKLDFYLTEDEDNKQFESRNEYCIW